MKSYKPDRRSLTTLKILVLAAAVLLIVLVRIFIKIYVLALILSIVFAAAAVIVVFAYLPHYFSNLSYCANESGIKKSSGVFFQGESVNKIFLYSVFHLYFSALFKIYGIQLHRFLCLRRKTYTSFPQNERCR